MNLDDPKLTAYALGELTDLTDPEDFSQIETWLSDNAEGQAFVEETRQMASLLTNQLHIAPQVSLTEDQRAAILEKPLIPFPPARRNWSIIGLTALAACLAVGPLLPWTELLRLQNSPAPTVAINTPPMTVHMPVDELKDDAQNHPFPDVGADKKSIPLSSVVSSPEPARQFELEQKIKSELAKAKPLLAQTQSSPTSIADNKNSRVILSSDTRATIAKMSGGWATGRAGGGGGVRGRTDGYLAKRTFSGNEPLAGYLTDISNHRDRAASVSNTESYDAITENDFLSARENPLSTFSIDVDTASYANLRRFINDGQLPPRGAVRIEEMLNYFSYDYAQPEGDAPFSTNLEISTCPWQPEHRLVRIGLRGKSIVKADRQPANLVFLIDVSGSMDEPNKLPLLKQSLRLLVDQLDENDRVALTVYAGSSGLVLPSTTNKNAIREALENLQPSGSTNGASGIKLAYEQAAAHFAKGGVNRVILATDGDFNVGITNQSDLTDLITEKAKSGVFLSVLGFGTGNLKDSTMEKLADKGNGNYAYIDSLKEGKKVLVEQMGGTLVTIAKDVKIQVEFNPAIVKDYRLIGYENRALKKEDFNDDKKDAGEIGAGHTVTALYEIVPVESSGETASVDSLKYAQSSSNLQSAIRNPQSKELLTVNIRYKEPDGDVSKKLEFPLTDTNEKLTTASTDFRFASAVAEAGQLLRDASHKQLASWESLLSRAEDSKGRDEGGYRQEFIELMRRAQKLTNRNG